MLARIALRVATIEALKGKTFVDNNVLDSEMGALGVAADGSIRTDQDAPFVSVYVDDSKIEDRLNLRALHRSGPTELTIETGITAAMTETDQETGESMVVGIGTPATDRALEFFLDCVGRQIVSALTDPRDAWAEVWRGLSTSILKIERKRTSDAAATGTRTAAHQLVITLDLLPDPVFGEPIASTSTWAKFLAQMEAVEHPFLPTLQALIGSSDGVLMHEAQRRRFGMTLDEARALLDIAVKPGEATEPTISSVTTERSES